MINLNILFRAMKNRNYRLFFAGQGISLTGTWMQQVALGWLVYRMTNSALLLGVVGFAGQIPAFFLLPFAGAVADRYHRRKALLITQFLAMLQAAILAFLVLTDMITVRYIIMLSAVLGVINSFDMPIRQAFTVEMVDKKEDLGNAIALNSSMFNLARLIGPSVAGFLIAAAGEGICFLVNAVSYIPVIISLCVMDIAYRENKGTGKGIFHALKEGFDYAFGFSPIRSILLLLALISFMGVSYQILMPVFAKDIFHGTSRTLGFFMAMAGAGALAGALFLAGRKSVIGLVRMIAVSSGLFGAGLVAFSFSRELWLSMAVIFVSGFSMMVVMASSNTILQTIVEDDKRGRVMSFYVMAFIGTAPFGSLLAGDLATRIGAPRVMLMGGMCCILGSILFARILPSIRKEVHPIYIKKGIIPEVAEGLRDAAGIESVSKL